MARKPKSTIPRKTDEEVRVLAADIVAGRVFTTWHIAPEDQARMLSMVFMPLGLMGKSELLKMQRKARPAAFYEYMDKAGPRAVNGYPMFFSLEMLNEEDAERVLDKYTEMTEGMT